MFRRRTVHSFARLTLAAFVFAQAALATAECGAPEHTAAQAIAAPLQSEPVPPCHERGGDERPNTNLCLEQCLSSDRSLDLPDVKVHPRPADFVLVAPPATIPAPVVVVRAATPPVPTAAPPPHVLFLPLRI